MDNPSAHKIAGGRQAIEARRADSVYLPPYAPNLNPNEQLSANLKALLRKVGAGTVAVTAVSADEPHCR